MRIEGTLTKWNDGRGFGFVTPIHGGADVFAHVSAFPKDGRRPVLGERVTFEIGTGKDGKHQANKIVCTARPYRLSEPARRPTRFGLLGRIVPIALLVGLVTYGYREYSTGVPPEAAVVSDFSQPASPSPFRCDGRTQCSQMKSCAEAEFFLSHCPGVEMDGNHDGEPCEQQWCH